MTDARPARLRELAILVGFGLDDARRRNVSVWGGATAVGFQGLTWVKWQVVGVGGAPVPWFGTRHALLAAAARLAPRDGLRLEFGVYRGESLRLLASLTDGPVYGFDSFEGLPGRWGLAHRPGDFTTSGETPGVPGNVVLVKGWFSETVPAFVRDHGRSTVALVHVDSDLYSSAELVLRSLQTLIRPGTVIVFDEYTTIVPDDEHRAFREFLETTGRRFRYVGCSPTGSVGVQITS